MPTIIDSFVVELGLDPKGFTEGQQQAVASLREVERASERAATHVDEVGIGILGFFRILENPAREIKRHLERIVEPARGAQRSLAGVAAQARRTGAAGEAGTLTMASGVRALSVAGLAATAVFVGLGKVIEGALGSARQTFGVGIGAAAAAMPINEFSAISQALFTHGNVAQEQTQAFLAGITQLQENLKLGIVDPAKMAAFGKLGVNVASENPEQIMEQLAAKFAGERDVAQVISQGASVGLTREQSVALRSAGANLPSEIAEARRTGVTQADVKAANDLLTAENRLDIAWQKLTRDFFTFVDPALVSVINGLDTFVNILDNINTTLSGIGDADTNDVMVLLKALSDLLNGNWSAILGDLGKLSDLQHGAPQAAPPADLKQSLPRATPDQIGVLGQIRQRESGGNYTQQNATTTASGAYQIVDGTWRMATQATGIGTQYAHAKDAPPVIQDQIADYLATKYGVNSSITWQDSGVSKGRPYPVVPGFPAAGSPQIGAAPIAPPSNVQGMLQGAQRGALAMNTAGAPVSNDNSRTTTASFGPIIVNTQATDGPGVVASIRDAVNRNLLVAQANVGLA